MAITKYSDGERDYYKVYVNIRSKTDKKRRLQKYTFKIKTIAEARREEKRLIRELSIEIERLDCKGLNWSAVVHLWTLEVKSGHMGKFSEGSARTYLSIIYKWTKGWDNLPAADIGRPEGRTLLRTLEKENLSKTYQKKIKNMINKVYDWGIEFGHIRGVKNAPLRGMIIDMGGQKPPDILSLEEIKRFLNAAKAFDHLWYPIWAMAVMTGLRSGELQGLTWDQIDLEKDLIIVDRSFDSNTKTIGPTKGRYWRTVPINSGLKRLIIELKANLEIFNSGFVLPRIKEWRNGDQAVPLRNFLASIKIRPVKFHTLRACFATQMLASGVPAPTVMKIGGWKNTSTMDIYLRLAGVDTKGSTECLEFIPDDIDFGENVVKLK
ncbi:MAG: site-specific integrase [Halobacteriovoraceae bacterium]|jgi:integrase|nr:site-specific integrase [Halobacteriovoraceae bacterium]